MDHHPIHLHGFHFRVTATDGEDIPLSAQWPEATILVAVGQTRNIEFRADAPGDWAMHCHMTHHVMNQMGHNFPNMVGIETRASSKSASIFAGLYVHGADGDGHGENGGGDGLSAKHDRDERRHGPFGTIFRWAGCLQSLKSATG